MGAQIILCDGFEVVPPPEMNDLIFFGSDQSVSNCDVSTVTTEEDGTVFSGDSSPGGAAEEEWPEAKPFSFYFVKQPVYDDPEIKSKIDEADQEIYRCNKLRIELSNAQKLERAEVSSLFAQMEGLVPTSEGYRLVFETKKREFDTLQEALRNLRCSRSSSDQLCFTKEELDHLIYIAHYQIEHGSFGLEDGDWVLKDTEKPDGIILSEDSLAQKEASINRVKSIAVELYEVKKELDAITWNISQLSDKMGKIQNNIRMLNLEMALTLEKRDKSYARIKMLRIQRDKGNAAFFQSHAVMRKAKELAASGNVRDLEVFASSEVDRFMNQWNNDKAFRDDYVKRISLSLCERQLNRDGRIKDPEVQVVRERQVLSKTMMMGGEKVYKASREDSSSNSSQDGNVITDKQKKETRKEAVDCNRSSAEESDVIDLEFPVYEKPKKEEEEVDEETLKERKREEQLEKARLAMERKRKLQEKAAAKAAIRAQKDAEKKLKECEKKAKKKAAANSSSYPSESDQSREVINEMEKVRTLTASGKEKHQKDRLLFPKQRSFRYKHRGRGTEALPKAILNRRKAHKYWVWGLSSAALACALFLVVLLLR
ncbi:PREDICTED: proton pump-interactor 2-like [Camelina sativa]|uniref:Proton pump-interactor 2-like n=1 Tax=Camelina sativa TaxID=90675 RepID=A0ABM0XKL8_CAMSA|nr:PREDICTED: proton pump-interactor 2-like [Camelina sativa]